MEQWTKTFVGVVGAIIGLAIVATLVSKNAKTADVIGATAKALSSVIGAAVNPIAAPGYNGNLGTNAFTSPAGGLSAGPLMGAGLNNNLVGALLNT